MIREQLHSCGEVITNVAQASTDGPTMILLHGVTRRWQDWLMMIPLLAPRWTIFALDFRGHGRSKFMPGYRVIDYATEVIAFLREHCREPAVIVGHSLGAMVAAVAAAEVPDRVRAIAMLDPPFDTLGARREETSWMSFFRGLQPFAGSSQPVAEMARELAEVQIHGPKTPPVRLGDTRDLAALRFAARCLQQLDPAIFAPILDGTWLDGYDRKDILSRVRCPALLLQAQESLGGMLTDADADDTVRWMPDCTRVRMANVGHQIHWMQPETAYRLLTAFLESC